MKKTILQASALLLLGVFVGGGSVFAATQYFTDVKPSDWYYAYTNSAYEKNIMRGYEDNTFRPQQNVTRAELAAVLDKQLQFVEKNYVAKTPAPTPDPLPVPSDDTSLGYTGGSLTLNEALKDTKTPITDNAFYLGSTSAKVTVVLYTDLEDVFSQRYFKEIMPSLKKDFIDTGKVRFIQKNFPVFSSNKRSIPAANAVLCAGDQGSYFDMYDQLVVNYDEWTRSGNMLQNFVTYAEKVSIETQKFTNCMIQFTHKNEITDSYSEAYYLGAKGTPATFLNGTILTDASGSPARAVTYEELKKAITKALE